MSKVKIVLISGYQNKTKEYCEELIKTKLNNFSEKNPAYNQKKIDEYFGDNFTIIFSPLSTPNIFETIKGGLIIKSNTVYSIEHIMDLLIEEVQKIYVKEENDAKLEIEKKLLPFQIPHFNKLYIALQNNNAILDASDTGTGKTYVALCLCKLLNYEPFVVAPKAVVYNWFNVAKSLDVNVCGVSNYESLKNEKYYNDKLEKIKCPYITSTENIDPITNKKTKNFSFNLKQNTIVIFDEAHRCKNNSSITSKLMTSMAGKHNKIMLLSATLTDKKNFLPFGKIFEFYNDEAEYRLWVTTQAKMISHKLKSKILNDDTVLDILHYSLFPRKGGRMKISELGDAFPKNHVSAQLYYCQDYEEIQKEYDSIKEFFKEYKNKEKNANFPLAKILYARMKIEQYKIPIFLDIAHEALDNNYSVVIFVCFSETLNQLAYQLKVPCSVIHGKQTMEERNKDIQDFQDNKRKVIIAMIQSGGTGLSLHDIHGGHPRMSIISASFNCIELKQSLGRISRAGSKSPAIQKLVYCGKTYEEQICKVIEQKLKVLDKLNDGFASDDMEKEIMMEIDKVTADGKDIEHEFVLVSEPKKNNSLMKDIITCLDD
ncbi:DEXDc helicase [Bodo saltans virus]|uniref:DEXDc helicase n=1 Tax=Bodo saltans virus TaxID=2024608 RepID=A0A2H4UVS4_9VIRU|nr:DEXDc helicase [Bodo saltans virus]ATZ81010.1 DEXDc helicase [Bodo saltans virus]